MCVVLRKMFVAMEIEGAFSPRDTKAGMVQSRGTFLGLGFVLG